MVQALCSTPCCASDEAATTALRSLPRSFRETLTCKHQTTGSLVSATSRSLLKLDQAHIAVGGREHINTQKTL